jgi:hypothetical protein
MRQTTGLSIVKPTAMSESKGPWVSMVLLERFSVQFLQPGMREGETFGRVGAIIFLETKTDSSEPGARG